MLGITPRNVACVRVQGSSDVRSSPPPPPHPAPPRPPFPPTDHVKSASRIDTCIAGLFVCAFFFFNRFFSPSYSLFRVKWYTRRRVSPTFLCRYVELELTCTKEKTGVCDVFLFLVGTFVLFLFLSYFTFYTKKKKWGGFLAFFVTIKVLVDVFPSKQ